MTADDRHPSTAERGGLRVRPYVLTGGRAATTVELPLETILTTTEHGAKAGDRVLLERRSILELATGGCSLTELAARIGLGIQVTRVLLGDLITAGLLAATPVDDSAEEPDVALLGQVLDGLERLS
ncbi:MAG: DUF742 domain-containing protein [Actinomycetota bacterium]